MSRLIWDCYQLLDRATRSAPDGSKICNEALMRSAVWAQAFLPSTRHFKSLPCSCLSRNNGLRRRGYASPVLPRELSVVATGPRGAPPAHEPYSPSLLPIFSPQTAKLLLPCKSDTKACLTQIFWVQQSAFLHVRRRRPILQK